jgi:hypothetical protein
MILHPDGLGHFLFRFDFPVRLRVPVTKDPDRSARSAKKAGLPPALIEIQWKVFFGQR